jgi:hypothetical protein
MIDDLVDANQDQVIGEKMSLFAYIYVGMGFCEYNILIYIFVLLVDKP